MISTISNRSIYRIKLN